MKAMISHHFLVDVADEVEAQEIADRISDLSGDAMKRELDYLGVDANAVEDDVRSCGSTVVVVAD